MNGLLPRKQGVLGLVLVILLLTTLFLVIPAIAYGDGGIGQPGDGLYSISRSTTGETTGYLESLVLLAVLNLLI